MVNSILFIIKKFGISVYDAKWMARVYWPWQLLWLKGRFRIFAVHWLDIFSLSWHWMMIASIHSNIHKSSGRLSDRFNEKTLDVLYLEEIRRTIQNSSQAGVVFNDQDQRIQLSLLASPADPHDRVFNLTLYYRWKFEQLGVCASIP